MKRTRTLTLIALSLSLAGAASAQTADPSGTVTFVTTADPTFNPWSPNAFVESNLILSLIHI